MEQAPVRLYYVAGIVAASLVIFTGTFSYGLSDRNRRVEAVAVQQVKAPARRDPAGPPSTAEPAPVTKPADAGPKQAGDALPSPKSATHVAQSGETLSQIARLYGVEVSAIRSANGLKSDQIQAGKSLQIPGAEPLRRHTVVQGDTLWELAARYGVDIEDLLAANKGLDPGLVQIGEELVIPPKTGAAVVTASASGQESVAAYAGMFAWPVLAPISSPFGSRWGRMHSGVDLAANMGDPIKAARDGEVLIAGTVSGYGNTIVLKHPDGTRTLYAHASKLLVRSGQKVRGGDLIALVGSTGHSTGPHLHFEIIVNNRPRDPLSYLPKR